MKPVVAVKGQAGTGKSRLVHEFLQSPQLSDWTVLKTAATAYRRGTPYLAISNLLRSWCEIPEQASPAEARGRLHEALAALPAGSSTYVPALQSLLELAVDDRDMLARRPFHSMNLWPALPGWRETVLDYYNACWALGRLIHRGFALDLGLDEDFFEDD